MATNLDPAKLRFDPSRWQEAIARLDAMDSAKAARVLKRVHASESLGDLMEHYDFGEPDWNGSLIVLASTLLTDPPTDVIVETYEDLALIDEDFGRRFHHGNVSVEGGFGAFENIWITGDLRVSGSVSAGFLDSFPDLLVAGDFRAAAMCFSGLTFVGGNLLADKFVMMQGQGEVILRGLLTTPLLLDGDAGSEFSLENVGRCLDVNEESMQAIATALGVSINPDDTHAFDLVHRALEALASGKL